MVTVYVLYLNNSFRSLTGDGGFGLMGVLAGRIAPSPAGSTVWWKVKVGCDASLYILTAFKDIASARRCDKVNSLIWGKMRFKKCLLQVHYGRGNIINIIQCVCSRLTCSSPRVSSICFAIDHFLCKTFGIRSNPIAVITVVVVDGIITPLTCCYRTQAYTPQGT